MATKITLSGSGQGISQNSVEKLRIKYILATPLEYKAGTYIQISDIIPEHDSITLNFQTTKKGSIIIASLLPLLFLAHVDSLAADSQAFLEIEASATPGTNVVKSITFNVPIFRGCKQFDAGNTLNISVSLTAGATVEIYSIDNPYQSPDAPAYQYNSKTVLANNGETIPENIEQLYLPAKTEDAWQLQLFGDAQSQWTLANYFAMFAEDWVTSETPYEKTNFVGLKVGKLRNLRLQAGASEVLYFTVS